MDEEPSTLLVLNLFLFYSIFDISFSPLCFLLLLPLYCSSSISLSTSNCFYSTSISHALFQFLLVFPVSNPSSSFSHSRPSSYSFFRSSSFSSCAPFDDLYILPIFHTSPAPSPSVFLLFLYLPFNNPGDTRGVVADGQHLHCSS